MLRSARPWCVRARGNRYVLSDPTRAVFAVRQPQRTHPAAAWKLQHACDYTTGANGPRNEEELAIHPNYSRNGRQGGWLQIVGVVGNERDDGRHRPPTAIVYWSLLNEATSGAPMAYASL